MQPNAQSIQVGDHLRLELEDDGGAVFIRLIDEQPMEDEGDEPIEIQIELRDVDAVIAALQQLKSQA